MMLKKTVLWTMFVPLLLILSQSAFATVILNVTPGTQTVLLSGQASVDITASNLQNEYIGAFDFNVDWDSSILSLASVSFGGALGGGVLSFQDEITNNALGISSLAEASFLSDLTTLQTGTADIVLATLVFNTLNVGQSLLSLTGNLPGGGLLGDENGFLLDGMANTGLIVVTQVPVPEILPLMGIGLLALLGIRRRNRA